MGNNNVVKVEPKALTGALKVQSELMNELNVSSENNGVEFTDYGKKCVMNAISGLVTLATSQGISFNQINGSMLKLALQNVGYTELNYAAMPSEVYFDLRKIRNADGTTSYLPSIKPQGAGNEKLLRKYGVGLKKDTGLRSPWLVREGDEITYPSFDGLEMIPPKWTPKSYDKKVIMVVYPAQKIDGSVEYLIATREGIKANIIAQIRQNTLYAFQKFDGKNKVVDDDARNKFYDELNKFAEEHTVDELIDNPKYAPYINPTYTSGGSKEQMILRKMKNNALKNYPKEYNNSIQRDAVESMWEDNDDSVKEKPSVAKDVVSKVEKELDEKTNEGAIQDFAVDEDGVVETNDSPKEEKKETPPVEEDKPQETDYGF